MEECNKYSNAELVWVQEEHKNQGGWSYVQPRFQTAIGGYSRRINYCGREVRFFFGSKGPRFSEKDRYYLQAQTDMSFHSI